MPLAFASFLAASLILWLAGAPASLVFAAALAAWGAFAAVIAPAIRRYRAAMGIAARLHALEASGWPALRLRLAGCKVVVVGLLTSGLPFVGAAAQWLGGQNLGLFFGPAGAGKAVSFHAKLPFGRRCQKCKLL